MIEKIPVKPPATLPSSPLVIPSNLHVLPREEATPYLLALYQLLTSTIVTDTLKDAIIEDIASASFLRFIPARIRRYLAGIIWNNAHAAFVEKVKQWVTGESNADSNT